MNKQQNVKGFTIIEVVLVLAIAALIFLMVFLALPALQRSQRDTARKSDVSSVSAAVNSYNSNNRGKTPSGDQIKQYAQNLSDNTTDVVTNSNKASAAPADGVVTVTFGTKCGDMSTTSAGLTNGATRQYTVVTKLESGGGAFYCLDS